MRIFALTLCALVACIENQGLGRSSSAPTRPPAPNVDAARELDQQGVTAFKEGRYRDALVFFREARRLGGPSSELWNIARCYQRLDEGEEAMKAIDEYLAQPDVTAEEKNDAQREGQLLRARPSSLAIVSTPNGASVVIDGQSFGATPLSTEILPGSHTIILRSGGKEERRQVEAKFGRALVVQVDFAASHK
jgi:tetratricopeptide (TPR) repeat protein